MSHPAFRRRLTAANRELVHLKKAKNMSADVIDYTDGILAARITGMLTHPELVALQQAASDIIRQQDKVRLLLVTENFGGWQRGGDWGDLSFQLEHDAHIEKMAIVGEKKWEDLALIFASKGFRSFPIEYFPATDVAKARAWLAGTLK